MFMFFVQQQEMAESHTASLQIQNKSVKMGRKEQRK